MWSGPRNLSTAMMRSWENRPDTAVLDEPLYAAYLAATGSDHPGADEIIADGHADYAEAIAHCVSHADAPVSYQKHMAHHLPVGDTGDIGDTGLGWLGEFRNCLLLRDPRRVLASYTKVREAVTLEEIGVPQQVALADHCEIIIDSDDFLVDPAIHQREICRRLGVPLDDELLASMLAWPAGPRRSDGIWAPHWYSAVESSTGFAPPPAGRPPGLPPHLETIADEALESYRELRQRRLVTS